MFLWKNSTDIDYISDAIKVIDEGLFILLLSFIFLTLIYVVPADKERVLLLELAEHLYWTRRDRRECDIVRADDQRSVHCSVQDFQVQNRL